MNDLPIHYKYSDPYYWDERSTKPRLSTYNAVRETRCGYWLKLSYGHEKWVSKDSRVRFAYPTEEDALNSYVIKKQRQILHCNAAIQHAKKVLEAVGVEPWKEGFFSMSGRNMDE